MRRRWFYALALCIGCVPVLGFVDAGSVVGQEITRADVGSRPGQRFVNEVWSLYLDAGIGGAASAPWSPPQGHILTVDFVSSHAWCPAGQKITISATVLNPDQTLDVEHFFVVSDQGIFPDFGNNPRTRFVVSQPVTLHVLDGGTLYFSAVRSAHADTCPVNGSFSGHYVDR